MYDQLFSHRNLLCETNAANLVELGYTHASDRSRLELICFLFGSNH